MDLATNYLGLRLKHPLIASSSPLTGELDNLRRLEDAGAAAVVLPSIFEEQVEHEGAEYERWTGVGTESSPETTSYFPPADNVAAGPHRYLELIRRARERLDIPVIASLNGVTEHGWTEYARLIEQAGASALELNTFFVPVDAALDGPTVEQRHVSVLRCVKDVVALPITIKLSPYFSAVGDMVRQLDRAGASGFSLFNRFYQPDIDLAAMRMRRDLDLSTPAEIRLPLLWIGVLAGQVHGSIAATTGVESAAQVVKYLLAGADVVMTASGLLRHGAGHMRTLVNDLTAWLEARDVAAIGDIRGRMSRHRLGDPVAFERGNYISILEGWPTARGRP
ncbi:MAG: dihydroorotate dehydrogenase-like protein [Rhodopila sp.]